MKKKSVCLAFIFSLMSCSHQASFQGERGTASEVLSCQKLLGEMIHEKINQTQVVGKLERLYSHQSPEIIQKRIAATTDHFFFLRSFVPYFYDHILHNNSRLKTWNQLNFFQGLTVGDAHPQNFGTLINRQKKVVYGINDPDDGARAPLFLDVLRYLTASDLLRKIKKTGLDKEQVKELLTTYKKGLNKKEYTLNKVTKNLIKDSKREGTGISKKWILDDGPRSHFKIRKDPDFAYDVSALKKQLLQDKLSEKFNQPIIVYDVYGVLKYTGGSGALNRYQVLMRFKNGEIAWAEFKQTPPKPGIFPLITEDLRSVSLRYQENIELQRGENWLKYDPIVNIDDSYDSYLLRFRRKGNNSIEVVPETSAKDFMKIAKDQMYSLGQYHRRAVKKEELRIQDYAQQFDQVKTENWMDDMNYLSTFMSESYRALKTDK